MDADAGQDAAFLIRIKQRVDRVIKVAAVSEYPHRVAPVQPQKMAVTVSQGTAQGPLERMDAGDCLPLPTAMIERGGDANGFDPRRHHVGISRMRHPRALASATRFR